MRKIQRLAAVGALAGLTVALGACGSEEEPAAGGGNEASAPSAPSEPESSSAAPSGEGVTTTEDIFGPACSAVPTEGEGSAQGMVDDPVGKAASNNPLLTTLTQTVVASNLVDTLNNPTAQYTVFAPANSAFEAIPTADLDALLADTEALTGVLTYHVLPMQLSPEELAGTYTTANGAELTIEGSGEDFTVGDGGATVVCGNVQTANATVYIIDQVMMPPAA